jgi:predicted DNA-binding protein
MPVGRPKRKEHEKVTLIQVRQDVYDSLDEYCSRIGITRVYVTSEAIRQYLKEKK